MHILLTDILSCPRCGPEFGLILLADRIEARRVLDGTLGCANCRSKYPIQEGVADLRIEGSAATEPGTETAAEPAETPSPDAALRWAALLGVTEGPAYLLIAGPAAALAGEIASLIEHIEVIAATDTPRPAPAVPGVSRIAVSGGHLPFYSGRVNGVALSGDSAGALLEEGMRVLGPLGRIVIDPAPSDVEERIGRAGLNVLLHQDRTLVAARAA